MPDPLDQPRPADAAERTDPADLFDETEPFDPAQHAVHGLLSAYFDSLRPDHVAKIEALISRITSDVRPSAVPSPRRASAIHHLIHGVRTLALRRRRVFGGGLAAAILITLGLFFWREFEQRAFAAALHAAAQANIDPNAFVPVVDAAEIQERLAAIETARNQRDHLLAIAPGWQPSAPEDRSPLSEAFECWVQVCRHLRDIGRFDESLAELDAAIQFWVDFPHDRPELSHSAWYWTLLDDFGAVFSAQGDFSAARDAFRDSIAAREAWIASRRTIDPQAPEAASVAFMLTPLYWRMSSIALMNGDLAETRDWLDKADAALCGYFAGVCRARGIDVPHDARAIAAYRLAPPEFRLPPEVDFPPDEAQACAALNKGFIPNASIVIKLREHLYRVARLRRSEGQYAAAQAALAAGGEIPRDEYRRHDGSRLEFFEPLESARIAILEGDYAAAIPLLDEAVRNRDGYVLYDPNGAVIQRAPIAPLSIAEMNVLRGVALLGQDGNSAEGRRLVGEALAVPQKMSQSLPVEQRAQFLRQFAAWATLAGTEPK